MSPILNERIIACKAEKAISLKCANDEFLYIIKVRTDLKKSQKKYLAGIVFKKQEVAKAFAKEFLDRNLGRKFGSIIGSPEIKELIEKYQEEPEKPVCSGHCGASYCDTNGCTERKRSLTKPVEINDN